MKPAPNSQAQQIALTVAAVVIAGLFFFGYHTGSKKQATEDSITAQGLKHRSEAVRNRLRDCKAAVESMKSAKSDLKAETQQLSAEYKKLQKDNEDMYNQADATEKKYADCMEMGEVQKATWTEEDAANAAVLNKLHNENRALTRASKQLLTTRGMRYQLLHHNIIRLKTENRQLLQKLGKNAQFNDEYYNGLIGKWRDKFEPWIKSEKLLPSEARRINDTVSKQSSEKFVFDPIKHKEIFVPQRDALGQLSSPTWQGRVGSPPATKGTYVFQRYSPMNRFPNIIQSLYSVALCAYENNILNFTFPSKFRRMPVGTNNSEEYIGQYIDTPLLTFCTDCIPMLATRDFRLLCSVQTKVYGTYSFWAMRSRIQFKPAYYDLAITEMKSQDLFEKPYLTVLWRRSPQWSSTCTYSRRFPPRRVYSWVNRTFEGTLVPEVSSDPAAQCDQDKILVLQAIKDRLAANPALTAVYICSEVPIPQELEYFTSQLAVPVKTLKREPSVEADVIDLILSSSGAELLANRYSVHSEVVVEMFLLRNNITPKGLTWF
jgi:hypothetical protein